MADAVRWPGLWTVTPGPALFVQRHEGYQLCPRLFIEVVKSMAFLLSGSGHVLPGRLAGVGQRALVVTVTLQAAMESCSTASLFWEFGGSTNVIILIYICSQPPNSALVPDKSNSPLDSNVWKYASLSLYCTFFSLTGQSSMNISPL